MVLFFVLALICEVLGTVGGFGSSVFFVPIALYFFPVNMVLGITGVYHIFSNSTKLLFFFRHIDWRLTMLYGIPGVLCVAFGAWLTAHIQWQYDQLFLAIFLIAFSSYLLLDPVRIFRATNTNAAGSGAVAGFLAGFIGTGGAVRGLSLSAFNLTKEIYAATSASIDMGIDVTRTLIYIQEDYLHGVNMYIIWGLLGVSFVGTYMGKILLSKISQQTFRKISLALILLIGIFSLGKAVSKIGWI